MKIKDAGFRALYHRLVILDIRNKDRKVLDTFPGWETANCMLAYGYFDHEAGITFEILELEKKSSGNYEHFGGRDDVTVKFRFGAVADYDFWYADEEEVLRKRHVDKIEMVHSGYAADKRVEESRALTILDEFRYENCPDDVRVLFLKNGVKPEACWVTITDMQDDKHYKGKLLNEPYADFGVHMGDIVSFAMGKYQNGDPVLYFHSEA